MANVEDEIGGRDRPILHEQVWLPLRRLDLAAALLAVITSC